MAEKDSWQIFSEQSKFFWGFLQTIAIVEVAVFSGWYTLYKTEKLLAYGLLIFGLFILSILHLILRRASQYLEVLRPHDIEVQKPLFGLKTSKLGRLIPLLLMLFNILLIVYTAYK